MSTIGLHEHSNTLCLFIAIQTMHWDTSTPYNNHSLTQHNYTTNVSNSSLHLVPSSQTASSSHNPLISHPQFLLRTLKPAQTFKIETHFHLRHQKTIHNHFKLEEPEETGWARSHRGSTTWAGRRS